MCAACEWQERLKEIEAHLVNSAFALHATDLLILAQGITDRQHVGDAIEYRLQDIEAAVKRIVHREDVQDEPSRLPPTV